MGLESIRPVGGNVEDPDSTDKDYSSYNNKQLRTVVENTDEIFVERYQAAKELMNRNKISIENEVGDDQGRIVNFTVAIGDQKIVVKE